MSTRVLVIGAGVTGLTTGVCLAEAGAEVTIRAAVPPSRTTSAAAGAVWGPVNIGSHDRVLPWARHTLDVLTKLAGEPGTGVRLATGAEVAREPAALPFWSGLLPGLRRLMPSELAPGFVTGWRYTAPLADMPAYLDYLSRRFAEAGGRLTIEPVTSLTGAPVVVNCTGVAARDLVPDPAVYPVRGQVVIADNPGLEEFLISRDEPATGVSYLFPHGDTVVIGGTVQTGAESLDPDPATALAILDQAARLEPRLRDVPVRGHRVGLRPCRPEVRLEPETRDGTLIWHNYGHGGAGISVSWGCATEVTAGILGLSLAAPLIGIRGAQVPVHGLACSTLAGPRAPAPPASGAERRLRCGRLGRVRRFRTSRGRGPGGRLPSHGGRRRAGGRSDPGRPRSALAALRSRSRTTGAETAGRDARPATAARTRACHGRTR